MPIPFYHASIGQEEIDEVVACLKSGWLTTGPRTKRFEAEFAAYVGARHAVALNSATAALHLALEAVGLRRGEAVLVPTMTFAATAEVVRYFDARPILVDCREDDLNVDIDDLRRRAAAAVAAGEKLRAVIPVHYGGQVADMAGIRAVAAEFGLRVIEDAAHCCPARYRYGPDGPWKNAGAESDVCCYSFYANKCITTGEGGMACTNDDALADRMRIMSLHGISKDAWKRFTTEGSWYYEILAPGYKYNLTDVAAAIGIHQLTKADAFREARAGIAVAYREQLSTVDALILPAESSDRVHSWHLFAIRLRLDRLKLDRAAVIERLSAAGIGTSVHWIPLHLHPYYRQNYGYAPEDYPVATKVSRELISLPIYPGMPTQAIEFVADTLRQILAENCRDV